MALSADAKLAISFDAHHVVDLAALTNIVIYEGAALADTGGNGYAAPLASTAAFLGFALAPLTMTGIASGARRVKAAVQGVIKGVTLGDGNGITDIGVDCYMSDDGTFVLSSSGTSKIGKVLNYDATTAKWDIFFQSSALRV